MIESGDVDAIYLPLPPALHFAWAERVHPRHPHLQQGTEELHGYGVINQIALMIDRWSESCSHDMYKVSVLDSVYGVDQLYRASRSQPFRDK